ncbi:uncharacterized protein LOC143289637 [Babylonia areolata]|uniref:uncharacterized protein LOC143289637 n=1 Tax=Babylonia areolata TaxID=304850 RepID=UPI003FD1D67E
MVELHKPAVIGIVEIKPKRLRYAVQESEISIPGFEMYHNLDKRGRGICLYVKEELKPTRKDVCTDFEETVFVDCKLEDREELVIGLVYRSPNSSEENNDSLNKLLISVAEGKPSHLLVLGDFNFPEIDWDRERCYASEVHPASHFFKAVKDAYLIQHQMQATRIRDGQTPTLDDLVLTNREDMVDDIVLTSALGKSDHATLVINIAGTYRAKNNQKRHNWNKADYEAMKAELQAVNWKEQLEQLAVEDQWAFPKNKLDQCTRKNVPITTALGSQRKKWLDGGTLTSVRTKHKLYRRWLQSRAGEDYQAYAKARNRAAKACRQAKRKLEAAIAEQSVYTTEREGDLPEIPDYQFNSELFDVVIPEEAVRKHLANLKTGKAPGPDGITPRMLVELADVLATPITMIFRRSLDTGGRSCTTQLLETLDIWTEMIDAGRGVDAVYMDFMKAFDSVPHRRLVAKVKAHGISGKPRHKTLRTDIEDVQRRATHLIGSLKQLSYPERLASLRLPSLEHRRTRGDMIDVYKYVHGIYDTDRPMLHLFQGRDTRGNTLKLAKGHCRLSLRAGTTKRLFGPRSVCKSCIS